MASKPGWRWCVRPSRPGLLTATIFTLCLAGHGVRAQVLEIGDQGQVTVYDRPAVFNDQGAKPIQGVSDGGRIEASADGDALNDAAAAAGLSRDLVEAVAWRESHFHDDAVSPAGAVGEMQLMPATARSLGVDPYDARQNLIGGATYLSLLMRLYDGDLIRALAAYNAGPGAVDRYGGTPPYRETRAYVAAIMDRLSQKAAEAATIGR